MSHNFNAAEWKSKQQAKADLGKPHAALNSFKNIGERLKKIEKLLNIKRDES